MTHQRPVEGRISNTYAQHVARKSVNPGTDYAVARGTVVAAPAAGRVARVRTSVAGSGAAGRFVVIYHDDGTSSDLLHLSRVDVADGNRVTRGQRVGLSGGSANGSETGVGAHVHWTLRTRQVSTLSNAGNVDPETRVSAGNPWSEYRAVQARLNVWRAHWAQPLLVVDGVFGKKSRAALTDFQERRGLTVDGKLGPASWASMSQNPPVVQPPVVKPPVVVAPVDPIAPEPIEPPVGREPGAPSKTALTALLATLFAAITALVLYLNGGGPQ